MKFDTSHHRSTPLIAFCVLLVGAAIGAPAVATASEPDPDCTDELQQVPRDGSVVDTVNIWPTYTGNVAYSKLSDAELSDVRIEGRGDVAGEIESDSFYVEWRTGDFDPGSYRWRVADGPEAGFEVSDEAGTDETPPTMHDGDIDVELDLVVYEEFPVMFRRWTVSFPPGSDDATQPENMRYMLSFTPDGDAQASDEILITPRIDNIFDDRIEVSLGGRSDRCNHGEPGIPITDDATVEVYAIDLAQNYSQEPAIGQFGGISEEKLAVAHDELRDVIATLDDEGDEAESTEEVVERLEANEEEEANDGCSALGNSNSSPVLAAVVLLGLVAVRRCQ